MSTRSSVVILAASCLAVIAGSSAAYGMSDGGVKPNQAVSVEQQASLGDGEISQDEYRAGFRRFQACLAAAGYEILLQGESNSTIQYSLPAAAVDSGTDAVCYDREFHQIDQMWQLAHEDTSHSADVLRECLSENGIAPKETLREMADQLADAGISQSTCAAA